MLGSIIRSFSFVRKEVVEVIRQPGLLIVLVIGPFLIGMKLPVQIAPMTAGASDLVTLAVLAAGAVDRSRGR